MLHGHTMRNYAKAIFAFAALAFVGACSDQSVAPSVEVRPFVAPANFTEVGDPVVFRVSNSEGITKRIGDHLINIPEGAICALESDYGTSFWDQECDPLVGAVDITATLFVGPNGEPYVDFQPAMRFVPSKEVMLFLVAGLTDSTKQKAIKYCNNAGVCVDESLTDASLRPFQVEGTSIIGRRVKHFSGYVVLMVEECAGTVVELPEGGYMCENGGLQRRSGYMVASGKDVLDAMEDRHVGKRDEH